MVEMEIEAFKVDQAEFIEIQTQLDETNKALESKRLGKIEREKKATTRQSNSEICKKK